MRFRLALTACACTCACCCAILASTGPAAHAALTINMSEVGTDVIATGSGTINFTSLAPAGLSTNTPILFPLLAGVVLAPTAGANLDTYAGITGPASIGAGGPTPATSGSGDAFGFAGGLGQIAVPQGYVSGGALAGSAFWAGQTFASLGATPGTYTWTWGAGPTADSLTVNIGAVAVPEPGTLALLPLGALALVGMAAKRRRSSKAGTLAA